MKRNALLRASMPTLALAGALWATSGSAIQLEPPALARQAQAPAADAAPVVEAAPGAGVTSVLEGAFTEEQAARGKPLYTRNCGGCHGNALRGSPGGPAIAGSRFNSHWAGGVPVGGLFEFVKTQMPPGKAGSLPPQAYIDIVAYILSFNGFPAGAAELPTDPDLLYAITIERPPQ